jgi:hypothetical protein
MKNYKSLFLIVIFLFALFGCSSEESEWEKAKNENSILTFEKFLKEYPKSEKFDSANYFIQKIDFGISKQKKSTKDFNYFIKKYPKSVFSDSAQLYIENIEFSDVRKSNKISVYIDFIKNYPETKLIENFSDSKVEFLINEFSYTFSKNCQSKFKKSEKGNSIIKESKFAPGSMINFGGLSLKVGAEGASISVENKETAIVDIDTETNIFEPYLSLYISKNVVLISGKSGAEFTRLSDKKIKITKGILYKVLLN